MQQTRYQHAKKTLQQAYKNVNPAYLSKQTRDEMNIQDDAFVYGEIDPQSLLNLIEIAKPKKNEVFYDLGSGSGRAAIAAALCFDFAEVVGIEFLRPLYLLSQNQWSMIQAEQNTKNIKLSFTCGDYYDLDISAADIVFFNATACRGDKWEKILAKFKELPVGSRLILTSHRIQDVMFESLYEGLQLMSWGMNSAYVYRKVL
ncbi:MAG: class I SAM-dependent methyltransferase [Gammaproteobacteria bacterium]